MRLLASRLCIDRGGRRILSDVSFELRSGLLVITGPNGTGKSSLLRVLAGLLPPSDGKVVIDETTDDALPHYIGHHDGLKPQLTAGENLSFAAGFLGAGQDGLDPLAALQAVDLAGASQVPVAWLSAGQKRRAALARLLVAPRQLWLLDEPTNGLDAASVIRFEQIAAAHLADGGLIVAATHQPFNLPAQELRLAALTVAA